MGNAPEDAAGVEPEIAVIYEGEAPVRAALLRALDAYAPRLGTRFTLWETWPDEASAAQAGLIYIGGAEGLTHTGAKPALHMPERCRLGAILDATVRILTAQADHAAGVIPIGPYTLDAVLNILHAPKGEIRLTDKEKEILMALYAKRPEALTREALLDAVWAYADGVETHTLETHIYRLRQKIEADPVAPKILLTTEAGYSLAQSD